MKERATDRPIGWFHALVSSRASENRDVFLYAKFNATISAIIVMLHSAFRFCQLIFFQFSLFLLAAILTVLHNRKGTVPVQGRTKLLPRTFSN